MCTLCMFDGESFGMPNNNHLHTYKYCFPAGKHAYAHTNIMLTAVFYGCLETYIYHIRIQQWVASGLSYRSLIISIITNELLCLVCHQPALPY